MTEEMKNELTTEQVILEREVYERLRAPFDRKCFSIDSSRGFDLVSLKAQYIAIRLNEVLGFSGWHFSGRYEPTERGVLFHGSLVIQIKDRIIERSSVGFGAHKTKTPNDGDTYKSARTDALSKAASYFGIAEEAFCGLISADEIRNANKLEKPQKPQKTEKKTNSPAPTFSKKVQQDDKPSQNNW